MDRNAEYFGVPILNLMEGAGRGVAEGARSEFPIKGKRILVACGTGNNGGGGRGRGRGLEGEGRGSGPPARTGQEGAPPAARAGLRWRPAPGGPAGRPA